MNGGHLIYNSDGGENWLEKKTERSGKLTKGGRDLKKSKKKERSQES